MAGKKISELPVEEQIEDFRENTFSKNTEINCIDFDADLEFLWRRKIKRG